MSIAPRRTRRRSLVLAVSGLCLAAPLAAQESTEAPVPALLKPHVLVSVGRIVDGSFDAPVVLGSEKEGAIEDRSLTVFDRIYVPVVIEGRALAAGDRVRTFRLEERVVDPAVGMPVGRILVPTGVAVVDSLAGEVAVATIERAFAAVELGDGVERLDSADTLAVDGGSVAGVTGYALAFQKVGGLHPPYDVAFLRMPSAGALGPGATVELYRAGETRAGRRLPDIRVARAMVVRVHGDVAAAIVYDLRRSDLAPGIPFRSVDPEP